MSDPKHRPRQTECDECGKCPVRIHRVNHGHRYCGSCYARVFIRHDCPKCGRPARLPRTDPDAICQICEREQPCIRCQRSDVRTGLITQYGRVCNACSVFFRPKSPCDACGQPSSKLSRVARLDGTLRLCPRCQRSDFRTCSACRHFRRVFLTSPAGHPLCRLCYHIGEIPCNTCGKLMPAGRVNCCEGCYWAKTARNRLAIDQNGFSSRYMAKEFGSFGDWLLTTYGGKTAALSIHRYLTFFLEIEKVWGSFPDYRSLVGHFKAEGLRRVQRPMRWLSAIHEIKPDPEIREETSERTRLDNILALYPSSTIAGQAIHGYVARLKRRQHEGKTTTRSIRLALTPAVGLSQLVIRAGHDLPNQKLLDAYLTDHPGQKAAIIGFINFLNREYQIDIKARVDPKLTRRNRRKKLEAALSAMMQNGSNDAGFLRKWTPVALEYFHDVKIPRRMLRSLLESAEYVDELGVNLVVNSRRHYIPVPTSILSKNSGAFRQTLSKPLKK